MITQRAVWSASTMVNRSPIWYKAAKRPCSNSGRSTPGYKQLEETLRPDQRAQTPQTCFPPIMSGLEIAGVAMAGVSILQGLGLSGTRYQQVTTTTKVRVHPCRPNLEYLVCLHVQCRD